MKSFKNGPFWAENIAKKFDKVRKGKCKALLKGKHSTFSHSCVRLMSLVEQ